MTPEEYQKICELCDAALKHLPGDRPGFLDRACADSPSLRSEVDKQLGRLAAAEYAGFLDLPTSPTVGQGSAGVGSAALSSSSQSFRSEPAVLPRKSAHHPAFAGSYADFIRGLLHRRMRAVTLISLALFVLFLIKDLWSGDYQFDRPRADFLVHTAVTGGIVVLTVLLWACRTPRTFFLRAVEIVAVSLVVIFQLRLQVELMRLAPERLFGKPGQL